MKPSRVLAICYVGFAQDRVMHHADPRVLWAHSDKEKPINRPFWLFWERGHSFPPERLRAKLAAFLENVRFARAG